MSEVLRTPGSRGGGAVAPGRAAVTPVALATVATVCSSVDVWVLMTMLLPLLQDIWAPAMTLQAVAAAAGYASVALLASCAPRRVNPLALSVASVVCLVGGNALWGWGMTCSMPAVAVAGVCAAHFGCAWPRITVGLSLCAVGNKRGIVGAAFLGEGVGALLRCVMPASIPLVPALGLVCTTELLMLAAGHVGAAPFLCRVLAGAEATAPADLDTTNPGSFLKPTHGLFVLIAFFEFVHGISLAEKSELVAAANVFVVVALAVGAAWLFARRVFWCEDVLLAAAALLMLGGFVLQPLTPAESLASSSLSFAGAAFSWVLIWSLFAQIGVSNPAGALWAMGVGYTMQALGLEAGSLLGRFATGWLGAPASLANVVNAVAIVAFMGYLLVGLRGFSFSDAFADIVPVAPATPLDRTDARIDRACGQLARSHGLSERELEVMGLLVRGRSGPEIQEALTVSRNTVKTHVRHIYRKLGVHSQQELVDLVGTRD